MTIIGITMGCPAGIGPEIILRYFAERDYSAELQAVVLGDSQILAKCSSELNIPANLQAWQPGSPVPEDSIPVLEISALDPANTVWGHPDWKTGTAMAHYIETGVKLAEQDIIQAITTCPIAKSSLNEAGYHFPGHTEMLASLTGSSTFAMMMAGSKLRVTLVTIHCPLRHVAEKLSIDAVYRMIETTHLALKNDFAIDSPRIAVAGLNPHGGEKKLFGSEEELVIEPAVGRARSEGMNVTGPYPPDTVFFKAASGAFDAVVCMYHDQGLIPFKLLHFEDGVNITLGLPIVRTSVDHGTAYDIAGKGLVSSRSLAEAVRLAAVISRNRARHRSRG